MTESETCPQCGAELPADAPHGVCPKCLLAGGLVEVEATRARNEDGTIHFDHASKPEATDEFSLGKLQYFGDYELLEEVARGGMGVVYRARQVSLNRIVAVKMILAGQLAGEREVQRFYAEAEAAAQLDHPGIVPIFEIGSHEGRHFFSMSFIEGSSLAEKLSEGRISFRDAAQIALSVSEAVAYAHHRGVIHRDLKPANVLLDRDDQPKIIDFGLAKLVQAECQLTTTGQVLGTPAYMSPEQAATRSEEVGPASDVYSIGAIFYEMLTGTPPHTGDSPVEVVLKAIEGNPRPVRSANANVPIDLQTICMKCLEKNPLRRYPNADALAAELGRFLRHEPIRARPVGATQRLWSWCKRHPWAISATTATCVAGLLCATYYLWTTNAYLRHQLAHPDYVREPGPLANRLPYVLGVYSMPFLGAALGHIMLRAQLKRRRDTGTPLSAQLLKQGSVICGIAVVGALYVAAKCVEAHVWEGVPLTEHIFFPYFGMVFGVLFLSQAYRHYDSNLFGTDWEPKLNPQEEKEIRDLLMRNEKVKAVQSVRRWKSVGIPKSKHLVSRIQDELHEEFPDNISRGTLRWPQRMVLVFSVMLLIAAVYNVLPRENRDTIYPVCAAAAVLTVFAVRRHVDRRRYDEHG